MDLTIRATPMAGGNALVRDYLAGSATFYTGHSSDMAAYARKAAEVEARLGAADRQRIAPAVEPLGDSASRLQRILDGDGFFVTTGQQPALYGGPLYTLVKVLAAIRHADMLERELGRPVLALFWVGADDHDWEEANHTAALDEREFVRRLAVHAPADAAPLPLSVRSWGAGIDAANEAFAGLLAATPLAGTVAAHARAEYRPDATVEASFTATMRLLLRDRPVAIVSSAHPLLRRASAPVMQREIEHSAAHGALLAERAAALHAAGYRAQVEITTDAANLMLTDAEGRDRLAWSKAGWRTRRLGKALSQAELLGSIATEPDRFSPNVLLRPVIENAVFPTIAYVAGPGELSYFAQIGPLFEAHGILPPVVVPRPSVLLIEPEIQRLLDRLGMDAADFRKPFEELASDLMRRRMPPAARAALDTLRTTLLEGYSTLANAAEGIDPTLRGPVGAARNHALLRLHETEKKIVTRMKRRDEETMDQLRRVASSIFPGGAPQERVLGPLPYLARYGEGFVAAVEAALP